MSNKIEKTGVGVGVMLLRTGKVLLGKRNSNAEKADSELHGEGSWTMPGGKLNFREKLADAAIREVFEETGIRIKKEVIVMISLTNDIVEDAHFITIGFFCEKFEGEAKVMEPDEITEWKWFALDDLPDPIFSPSKKIIDNFIKRKFFDEEQ